MQVLQAPAATALAASAIPAWDTYRQVVCSCTLAPSQMKVFAAGVYCCEGWQAGQNPWLRFMSATVLPATVAGGQLR